MSEREREDEGAVRRDNILRFPFHRTRLPGPGLYPQPDETGAGNVVIFSPVKRTSA